MRIIKISNKEIFQDLKDKEKQVEEGRKISEKIESMETQRNVLGMKIQKIKDRVIPLIEEAMKDEELGEFEAIGEVRVGKIINEIEIEIFDQVESYKEYILEKKKEAETNEENQSAESATGEAAEGAEGEASEGSQGAEGEVDEDSGSPSPAEPADAGESPSESPEGE